MDARYGVTDGAGFSRVKRGGGKTKRGGSDVGTVDGHGRLPGPRSYAQTSSACGGAFPQGMGSGQERRTCRNCRLGCEPLIAIVASERTACGGEPVVLALSTMAANSAME